MKYVFNVNFSENTEEIKKSIGKQIRKMNFIEIQPHVYSRNHPLLEFELQNLLDIALSVQNSPNAIPLTYTYHQFITHGKENE